MSSTNFKLNRILASLIDGLVMLIIFVAICITPSINLIKAVQANNYVTGDILWLVFSFIDSVLIWILYLSLTGFIFKNATLGMKIMKLAFARSDSRELTFLDIFTREVTFVVCLVLSLGLSLILDPISLLVSEHGKNFYDIFSFTKVVSLYDLN